MPERTSLVRSATSGRTSRARVKCARNGGGGLPGDDDRRPEGHLITHAHSETRSRRAGPEHISRSPMRQIS